MNFLKYFFTVNKFNIALCIVYPILMCALFFKYSTYGPGLCFGLGGFWTGIFLFNLIAEIKCYFDLKKSGDL